MIDGPTLELFHDISRWCYGIPRELEHDEQVVLYQRNSGHFEAAIERTVDALTFQELR